MINDVMINKTIIKKIQQWLRPHKASEWPPCILNFKGIKNLNVPRFESLRHELKEVKHDPYN